MNTDARPVGNAQIPTDRLEDAAASATCIALPTNEPLDEVGIAHDDILGADMDTVVHSSSIADGVSAPTGKQARSGGLVDGQADGAEGADGQGRVRRGVVGALVGEGAHVAVRRPKLAVEGFLCRSSAR